MFQEILELYVVAFIFSTLYKLTSRVYIPANRKVYVHDWYGEYLIGNMKVIGGGGGEVWPITAPQTKLHAEHNTLNTHHDYVCV